MHEITVCYYMPFGAVVGNGSHHIDCVPVYYCIGHAIETTGLIGLIFGLMPSNVALIGEKEKLPESMQGLPLVELSVYAPSVVWVFQIAQDEERLHQATIFL